VNATEALAAPTHFMGPREGYSVAGVALTATALVGWRAAAEEPLRSAGRAHEVRAILLRCPGR